MKKLLITLVVLITIAGPGLAQIASPLERDGRTVSFPLGYSIRALESAQIFGSTLPDAAFAGVGNLTVFVSEGPCNSPTEINVPLPGAAVTLEIADMDSDGDNDIVVAYQSLGFHSIFFNQGIASYTFVRVDTGAHGAISLAVQQTRLGDIDGDGDNDIGVGNRYFPNLGGGSFGPVVSVASATPMRYFSHRWADIDGDGDLDLVALDAGPGGTPAAATALLATALWRSNGAAPSALDPNPVLIPNNGAPFQAFLFVGDANRDGIEDILFEVGVVGIFPPSFDRTLALGSPGVFGSTLVPIFSAQLSSIQDGFGTDVDQNGEGEIIIRTPSQFPPTFPDTMDIYNFTGSAFSVSSLEIPALLDRFVTADFNGDGAEDFAVHRFFGNPSTVAHFVLGGEAPIYSLTIISGADQSVAPGSPLAEPIVMEVRNCLGHRVPNHQVSADLGNFTLDAGSNLVSDSMGRVNVFLTAPNLVSQSVLSFESPVSPAITTTVNVTDQTVELTFAEGLETPLMAGQTRSLTIVATHLITGSPVAGVQVSLTGSSTAAFNIATPSSQLSDSNGEVFFDIEALIPSNSLQDLTATASGTNTGNTVESVFVRGLRVNFLSVSQVVVLNYFHENAGIPILVAASPPLAGGPVPTLFGPVETSVLSPGPGLVYLDGLGAFGPPDPGVQTPFLQVYSLGSSLAGVSLAIQVYGVDSNYNPPNHVFISNAVTQTF